MKFLLLTLCHFVLLVDHLTFCSEKNIEIEYLKVYSIIQTRFATTLITCRAHNLKNESQQAHFSATLPEEAFITNFSMQIGNRLTFGDVRDKEKAEKVGFLIR